MVKLNYFNEDWINSDLHRSQTWIRKVEDKNEGMCVECRKTFSLSKMGF